MISRKTTVSALALVMASAGAAAAFPATATTDLNVRSGPGTGYSVVDQLQDGQTVEVTAQNGGWYQIDGQGWASGNYLDAGGSAAVEVEPGYEVAEYGEPAFYYGSDPYYWNDAGFYFIIRDGRRHRVGWDWFRDRDYRRDFRWSNNRYRGDFERHRGNWDGDRDARRGDRDGRRVGDSDQRRREGDLDRNGEMRRGERVDGQVAGDGNVRSGRASAEGGTRVERSGRAEGGEGRVSRAGRGGSGEPPVLPIPGGGY